jgi:hypothetical protein
MKRQAFTESAFILMLLLIVTGARFVCLVSAQSTELFQGWQVQNIGGYYSESDGTIRLWSDAHDQGVVLYKEISPKTDFEFSLQVKANRLDGFGILVGRQSFLTNSSKEGVSFEFHNKYGVRSFLLARYVNTVVWETGKYGDIWDWYGFAVGEENVWYTMKLKVQANPFRVSGEVLDENGVSLGSYSVSDMINLSFEDITHLGFKNTWGGDYYIKNVSDIGPISTGTVETRISIFAEVPSSTLGSPINVRGKLTDSNGSALTNEVVVLWYTFAGLDEWVPISSSFTNEAGNYSIQWVNTASGNFTLRAGWHGNSTHLGSRNTTILSVLPYQNQAVFFVESNSTVTALTFDSASSELDFSATGPSGTTGFVKVTLAKNLVANDADIEVYLDGNKLNHSATLMGDSWLVEFSYSHSTHKISVQLPSNEASGSSPQDGWLWTIIATGIICASIAGIISFRRRKQP